MMGPTQGKVVRFIVLFIACVGLAVSMLACSKASQADAEAAIRQQDAAWIKAIGNRQLDATVSYYADGALLLAPNVPIARTKDEIRETWRQFFASLPAGVPLSGETTKVQVAGSGDFGYAIGTYTYGNPPTDKGKYAEVWKKQADGSWKAVVDTFNSDLPAPPAAR